MAFDASELEHAVEEIQDESMATLRKHIRPGKVALLDFPSHQNAGDTVIFAGQEAYLKQLGAQIDYISDISRYDPKTLADRVPDGPILLQGGGNFGDLWPDFQEFRERVVRDFPHRKIILFPQSIAFSSEANAKRARDEFAKHPDLTLMLRDKKSIGAALEYGFDAANHIEYCPDLSLGMGLLSTSRRSSPQFDVIGLMRRDLERNDHGDLSTGYSTAETDWGLRGVDQALWKLIRIPGRVSSVIPGTSAVLYPLLTSSYRVQARLNLRRARDILASGRVVLTDRLHATVYGALMGKEVVSMDNSYGKVSSIYSDYLHRLPNITFAHSAEEATAKVRELLAQ